MLQWIFWDHSGFWISGLELLQLLIPFKIVEVVVVVIAAVRVWIAHQQQVHDRRCLAVVSGGVASVDGFNLCRFHSSETGGDLVDDVVSVISESEDFIRLWGLLLLDNVSKFVGEEVFAAVGARGVLARGKRDVGDGGVRECLDRSGGCRGLGIGVHANVGKVLAKSRLHKGAGVGIERVTS